MNMSPWVVVSQTQTPRESPKYLLRNNILCSLDSEGK